MAERYQDSFSLTIEGDPASVVWTGNARFLDEHGKCLKSLKIRVCCPDNYPDTLPSVHDVAGKLTKEQCGGHMMDEKKHTLCYGTRLDELLKPGNLSVANVITCVEYFVASLWCHEHSKVWHHGHPHGDAAFLAHEVNGHETIKMNELCPCGLRAMPYRNCHYRKIMKYTLIPQEKKMEMRNRRAIIDIAPNSPCPCGSKAKYKKCCSHKHRRENFSHSPLFMLLKYPELNPDEARNIRKRFEGNGSDFAKLIRTSPIAQI